MVKHVPIRHWQAWLTLLTALMTSCTFSRQWTLKVEKPVREPWFLIEHLEQAQIAVIPHARAWHITIAHPGLDDRIAASLGGALTQSEVMRIPSLHSKADTPSVELGLEQARAKRCEWLVLVRLLDVRQERAMKVEQVSGDGVEEDPYGEIITETSYVSATSVDASLELLRVADGARAFHVKGTYTCADANSEDDDYGGFLNWLLLGVFASADYPPFPESPPLAYDLITELVNALRATK
tara:strand:- start:57322 stop:58038 length:717 start_codon:yes stop_codon:yes gene_type:complete